MQFKSKEPLEPVTVRLPSKVIQEAKKIAELNKGLAPSEVLREIIVNFFAENRIQNGNGDEKAS